MREKERGNSGEGPPSRYSSQCSLKLRENSGSPNTASRPQFHIQVLCAGFRTLLFSPPPSTPDSRHGLALFTLAPLSSLSSKTSLVVSPFLTRRQRNKRERNTKKKQSNHEVPIPGFSPPPRAALALGPLGRKLHQATSCRVQRVQLVCLRRWRRRAAGILRRRHSVHWRRSAPERFLEHERHLSVPPPPSYTRLAMVIDKMKNTKQFLQDQATHRRGS